jgi:hypothetical protein
VVLRVEALAAAVVARLLQHLPAQVFLVKAITAASVLMEATTHTAVAAEEEVVQEVHPVKVAVITAQLRDQA